MDLCNSRVRPSVFPGKNFNVGHYTQTVYPNYFIPAVFIGHHYLLPFCNTFTDFDLAWGSQGQCETNHIGFIFLHIFHLIRMKFGVVRRKQFKLSTLRLTL